MRLPFRVGCLPFLIFAVVRVAAHAVAAEPILGVVDAFQPGSARRPKAGEWLEYRIAFPVDPLENRLSLHPLSAPDTQPAPQEEKAPANTREAGATVAMTYITPVLEPTPPWRVLPLRLEVRKVEENGCQVTMTFEGMVKELFLPLSGGDAIAEFHYDAPSVADAKTNVLVGGNVISVDRVRREGREYGFVRLSNPELPFGLARFATANVDLILVGMGLGFPPSFPLSLQEAISPPPGFLY